MIQHQLLAQLSQYIYSVNTSYWDHYLEQDGVVLGVKKSGDADIVVFRGSDNLEDWRRDLDEVPKYHPILGFIHQGFLDGMDKVAQTLIPALGPSIVVTGHSLGAARAWILSGLLSAACKPAAQVTVFGSPRPGFKKLREVIMDGGSVNTSYRDRLDPVTEVPYLLGEYVHVVEPIPVDCAPGKIEPFPPEDHFIQNYVKALQLYEAGGQ